MIPIVEVLKLTKEHSELRLKIQQLNQRIKLGLLDDLDLFPFPLSALSCHSEIARTVDSCHKCVTRKRNLVNMLRKAVLKFIANLKLRKITYPKVVDLIYLVKQDRV